MKIVLARPNYNSHIITPPLGLGYLASYLKKHGIEAKIIDGLARSLSTPRMVQAIEAEQPDAVGITCLTSFYHEAVALSRLLKTKRMRVIMGGVHPTFLPYETLADAQCDYVISGEGEIPLLKIAQNRFVDNGIPGVYSLSRIKKKSPPLVKAERVENLDEIPFPDWEQMAPQHYPIAPHGAIPKNHPIGVVTTTRGCPYQCAFCASPGFFDRKIRFRTPENVVAEIQYLVDTFGVREIHFEDDNLTFNRKHAAEICRLIIKNGIDISWSCPNGIRADRVDSALLSLMKKSGCYCLAYGIESASEEILQNIRKHEAIETITAAIDMAHSAGISCQGFFIFGLPGETRETIKKSISYARRSRLSRAQFLILDVLPGSELWDRLKGGFTPDWTKNSYREPEWIPATLTRAELMNAQARAFREFYVKCPRRFLRLLFSVKPGQLKYLLRRLLDFRIVKAAWSPPRITVNRIND